MTHEQAMGLKEGQVIHHVSQREPGGVPSTAEVSAVVPGVSPLIDHFIVIRQMGSGWHHRHEVYYKEFHLWCLSESEAKFGPVGDTD
jgi:hypothetical protein